MTDATRVPVKTLPQIAARLGIHRSTLVRMEQRGVITKAPFAPNSVAGRVYTKELEEKVVAEVQAYFRGRHEHPNGVAEFEVEIER